MSSLSLQTGVALSVCTPDARYHPERRLLEQIESLERVVMIFGFISLSAVSMDSDNFWKISRTRRGFGKICYRVQELIFLAGPFGITGISLNNKVRKPMIPLFLAYAHYNISFRDHAFLQFLIYMWSEEATPFSFNKMAAGDHYDVSLIWRLSFAIISMPSSIRRGVNGTERLLNAAQPGLVFPLERFRYSPSTPLPSLD